ncbi:hypothetical protein TWF730_002834 [Orbilia blumenaviensis]|uniref:Uncharacterized protein n=1 Tax=Orbilia blumenaviensis TaxID=1796055 RepID=A0AAV9UBR1_9PEZI
MPLDPNSSNIETDLEHVITGSWLYFDNKSAWHFYAWTLTKGQYSFLNNVLVFFLTIVAERFWVIVVFIIYLCSSNSKRNDGFRQEFKITARNLGSLGVVLTGLKIFYVQGKQLQGSPSTWMKNLLIFIFALIVLVSFLIAGIYLGRLEIGGVARLKSSDTCGLYTHAENGSLNQTQPLINNIIHTISLRNSAAANNWTLADSTGYLLKDISSLLHLTIIPCPFRPDLCANNIISNSSTSAVKVDTGHVSIRKFGLNSPYDITIRRVQECAVLSTDGSSYMVSENEKTPVRHFNYMYGPITTYRKDQHTLRNTDSSDAFEVSNITFSQKLAPDVFFRRPLHNVEGYSSQPCSDSIRYMRNCSNNYQRMMWEPLPEFNKNESFDMGIIFITPILVSFDTPINDMLYKTLTTPSKITTDRILEQQRYTRQEDDPTGVLACKQHMDVCVSGAKKSSTCTGLQSIHSLRDPAFVEATLKKNYSRSHSNNFDFTDHQKSLTLSYITAASQWYDIGDLAYLWGDNILLANSKIIQPGLSADLPDNFWHEEVKGLMAIGIISTLYELRSYAQGKNASIYDTPEASIRIIDFVGDNKYKDTNKGPICLDNMILVDVSATHSTIAVIPLLFMIFFGLGIITVSSLLVPLLSRAPSKIKDWQDDSIRQLPNPSRRDEERGDTNKRDGGFNERIPDAPPMMMVEMPSQQSEQTEPRQPERIHQIWDPILALRAAPTAPVSLVLLKRLGWLRLPPAPISNNQAKIQKKDLPREPSQPEKLPPPAKIH